jgi:nicotinamidase-related amidase
MDSKPWNDILTQTDINVIEASGYGESGASSWESKGIGKGLALIVVDMQSFIVGRNVPILDAINDHRSSIGEVAWEALDHIRPLITLCRSENIPIIYTKIQPGNNSEEPSSEYDITDELDVLPSDILIEKRFASAFFGTTLIRSLVELNVDTLIIVGNTTSGCVRATAVDAQQHGYKVVIPIECVFDRIQTSHKIGLLDIWMKYGEVLETEAIQTQIIRGD